MHFGRQKGYVKIQLARVATGATLQQQLICIRSSCSISLKQFALRLCNWKMFALQYAYRKHAWPWHAPVDRPPFHVTIGQLQPLLCNHLTNFFPFLSTTVAAHVPSVLPASDCCRSATAKATVPSWCELHSEESRNTAVSLDYCGRVHFKITLTILHFLLSHRALGWQSFHTTSSMWSEQVVKVPPFADSITEGDIK